MNKVLDASLMKNKFINTDTALILISSLFERASYYGIRSVLVIYLIDSSINMPQAEAISLFFSIYAFSTLFSIIGALIGDLLFGNHKTIILGGIIQTIGCLSFVFINNNYLSLQHSVYVGLILFSLGTGLYSPNMRATFGKQFLKVKDKLPSAFTLLYIAINIGSFLGPTLYVYLGEIHDFSWTFYISAASIFVATILFSLTHSTPALDENKISDINLSNRIKLLGIIILILVPIYWAVTLNIESIETANLISLPIPENHIINNNLIPAFIESLTFSLFSIFFFFYWLNSKKTIQQNIKTAFMLIAAGSVVSLLFSSFQFELKYVLIIITLVIISISKVIVYPIISTSITKYINPRYLAIAFSFVYSISNFISSKILVYGFEYFELPSISLTIGIIISLVIIVYLSLNEKLEKGTPNVLENRR